MQCLTTDVLIIFIAFGPVKLVHELLLNPFIVQAAFEKSCNTLVECFNPSLNLATDSNAISYLYRFIIQGFVRVYAKDIYQLRLSNVLLSKSGASGIRTALLTLSASASSKRKCGVIENDLANEEKDETIAEYDERNEGYYKCPCGKEYKKKSKTWYARHISLCTAYVFVASKDSGITPPLDRESIILDNLLELECVDEIGDFAWDIDRQIGLNLERTIDEEESNFDSSFVAGIVVEDDCEHGIENVI
jgi:hypothetical protein